jgi:hypothetical protein
LAQRRVEQDDADLARPGLFRFWRDSTMQDGSKEEYTHARWVRERAALERRVKRLNQRRDYLTRELVDIEIALAHEEDLRQQLAKKGRRFGLLRDIEVEDDAA